MLRCYIKSNPFPIINIKQWCYRFRDSYQKSITPCLSCELLPFYMVQDLSVGPWDGEEGPILGFVFGRTMGFGLSAGGFSCTPILGVTMGLNVLMVSLEELVLRRIWGSVPFKMTLWIGLNDSVEVVLGEFFICSKVSSTTSGACFAELWRSSSRSSFKAVFIVSSISCSEGKKTNAEV